MCKFSFFNFFPSVGFILASNLLTMPFVLVGLKFEVWPSFLGTTAGHLAQIFSARIYDMYLH